MAQNETKQQQTKVFLKNIYPRLKQKVEKYSENNQWCFFFSVIYLMERIFKCRFLLSETKWT